MNKFITYEFSLMNVSAVAESTIQEKSPWDSNAVLVIFCNLRMLS